MKWVAVLVVVAGCPCGGNPGVMTGASPNAILADTRFVDEKASIYVSTSTGIAKVSLDGSSRTKVFAKFPHRDVPGVSVVDISLDWKTWLLSDSDTNLWIGDPVTGNSVEVKAVHHRMSNASVSPDGKWVAASRHSDYGIRDKPEDDTIFLIEIATGKVDTIPAQTKNWPTKVRWAADGSALLLEMAWEAPSQWLTLADRKRTEIPYKPDQPPPAPLRADPRRSASPCTQHVITGRLQPAAFTTTCPTSITRSSRPRASSSCSSTSARSGSATSRGWRSRRWSTASGYSLPPELVPLASKPPDE